MKGIPLVVALGALPFRIYLEAVINVWYEGGPDSLYKPCENDSFRVVLAKAFRWDKTHQGGDYWLDIAMQYE